MIDLDNEEFKKRINEMNNPLNWQMLSDGQFRLEDLPPIIPLIFIQDNGHKKPYLFTFGNNLHDNLLIETENNHSYLFYENLQSGCSSRFCDEGYQFYDNANTINADYIEPHVKLVNLAKLIDKYNKENNISDLKNENKQLRELGTNYAKQVETVNTLLETYKKMLHKTEEENQVLINALSIASDILEENDKAYKTKSKQKTSNQHYKQLIKKSKEMIYGKDL